MIENGISRVAVQTNLLPDEERVFIEIKIA